MTAPAVRTAARLSVGLRLRAAPASWLREHARTTGRLRARDTQATTA